MIEQMNLPAQDPEFGAAVATGLSAAASQGRVDLPGLVDWLGTLDFRAGAGFSDDWQQVTEAAAILAARSDDVDDARWTIVARLAHGWLDRTGDLFAWRGTQVRDLPLDQRRRLASEILQRYTGAYTVHNLGRESRLAFDDREWWLSQPATGLPAGARPGRLPSAAASQETAPPSNPTYRPARTSQPAPQTGNPASRLRAHTKISRERDHPSMRTAVKPSA
jgi:hypothetical protein